MHFKKIFFLICALICSLQVIELKAQDSYYKTDSIAFIRDFEATQRKNAIISIEKEGGKIATHILDRGENLEYIARYYGADLKLIKQLNGDRSDFFYGEEILVPVFSKPSIASASSNAAAYDAQSYKYTELERMYNFAFSSLSNGDYKGALKAFNKLVKKDKSVRAYYGRGCTYSKLKKHRQATNDLGFVLKHDAQNIFPEAEDLYEKESAIWERQQAERAELARQIIGGVFQGASLVGQTYLQVKQIEAQSKRESSGGYSSSGSSGNYASSGSSSESKDDDGSGSSSKKRKCGICGGKGTVIDDVANFGIDTHPYCEECGKTVTSGHYHKTCSRCHGKGEY